MALASQASVTMTAPITGTVTNNNEPTLSATTTGSVTSLQFQYSSDGGADWTPVGSSETAAPYSFTFTSPLPDGTYEAEAVATPTSGGTITSAPVTFTIQTLPSLNPVATKDDGAWGYDQRGVWQIEAGGFNGSHRTDVPGSATDYAQWLIAVPTNTYEIFADWTGAAGNASNATYQIKDGGTVVGTVSLDQTQTPQDAAYAGLEWASLGTYTFTTGVITVTLSDLANGTVVADGILVNAPLPLEISGPQTSGTVTVPAGTTLGGVTFEAGTASTTVDGSTINLAGNITNNSGKTQTINTPLVLVGDPALSAAAGELLIKGAISGGDGIVITGGGTVVLAGADTYTGGTQVTGGTLIVANADGLPAGSSLMVGSDAEAVFAGGVPLQIDGSQPDGTLDLPAGSTVDGIVFDVGAAATAVDGNGIGLAGNITDNSADTQTINASLALTGGDRTLHAATGRLVINGAMSGGYGIVTSGSGTVVLAGASTYTGGTAVTSGTLIVTNADSLPAGSSLAVGSDAALLFSNGSEAVAAPLHISGSKANGTLNLPAGTTLGGIVFDAGAAATAVEGIAIGLAGDIVNNSNMETAPLGPAHDAVFAGAVFAAGDASSGGNSVAADLARLRLPRHAGSGQPGRQVVDALLANSAQWLPGLPPLGPFERLKNPAPGGQN